MEDYCPLYREYGHHNMSAECKSCERGRREEH